jgi:hypothetical protein
MKIVRATRRVCHPPGRTAAGPNAGVVLRTG